MKKKPHLVKDFFIQFFLMAVFAGGAYGLLKVAEHFGFVESPSPVIEDSVP